MNGCAGAKNPEHNKEERKLDENDLELDEEKAMLYRSDVCTLLYPASDFITAQHGIRELSTELKNPKESSSARLNRIVRYMATARYHGLKFQVAEVRQVVPIQNGPVARSTGSRSDACIFFFHYSLWLRHHHDELWVERVLWWSQRRC